jgi:hypothetical protein
MSMFNRDFYPTPFDVIVQMTEGEVLKDKIILEPSAGKGDIVDYLINAEAKEVLACEINEDLKAILSTKCRVIESDFLKLTSDRISHINMIILNPPFTADEKHINHAYNIAPPGCKIIALCNSATLENSRYSSSRQELKNIIETYGTFQNLQNAFSEAERKTNVNISLVKIQKPGADYNAEFEGFFMDEEVEEQGDGLMPYNFIRDVVNRYVGAVKVFDKQLISAIELNELLSGFYGSSLAFQCTEKEKPVQRATFKKDMQRAGWKFIFNKMNMTKNTTKGTRESINKFVEEQTEIPFTMRNIYHMLDIVFQTRGQTMDKALLEVFDHITAFHDDNKYGLPGWKTNSHFLLTQRFIHPGLCTQDDFDKKYHKDVVKITYGGRSESMDDMVKAICYLIGEDYDAENESKKRKYPELFRFVSDNRDTIKFGEWFDWTLFKVRAYKKGTMHFEFKDPEIWGKFNQRIAKIKGFPLFEAKAQTAYQNRQTGRPIEKKEPVILASFKLKTAI